MFTQKKIALSSMELAYFHVNVRRGFKATVGQRGTYLLPVLAKQYVIYVHGLKRNCDIFRKLNQIAK